MRGRIVMGSAGFLKSARKLVGRVTSEQPARRFLSEPISFERIVEVVEEAKEEAWDSFHSRYGDWGRPLALYLARKRSGLTLREIGEKAGGMEYKAVSTAVQRFAKRLECDRSLRRTVKQCLAALTDEGASGDGG